MRAVVVFRRPLRRERFKRMTINFDARRDRSMLFCAVRCVPAFIRRVASRGDAASARRPVAESCGGLVRRAAEDTCAGLSLPRIDRDGDARLPDLARPRPASRLLIGEGRRVDGERRPPSERSTMRWKIRSISGGGEELRDAGLITPLSRCGGSSRSCDDSCRFGALVGHLLTEEHCSADSSPESPSSKRRSTNVDAPRWNLGMHT